jgi:hypothetical protein
VSTITVTPSGSQVIQATVSGGIVQATVPQTGGVGVAVTGGIGPAGPAGPSGAQTLSALLDVSISSAALGDVLRYNGTKWTDYPDIDLTDGGAF